MTNQPEIKANDLDDIRILLLDVHNNPSKYVNHQYIEQDNLLDDLKEIIKSSIKYGIQFRYTNPESKKQMVFIDKDDRIKLLGQKGNCLKSDTIFHFSRIKYIIANGQNTLSIKAISRIIADRKKIKLIDIDHINSNKLDNRLKNLQAIPHNININGHFDTLKQLSKYPHKAKEYAKKNECEFILPFIF